MIVPKSKETMNVRLIAVRILQRDCIYMQYRGVGG